MLWFIYSCSLNWYEFYQKYFLYPNVLNHKQANLMLNWQHFVKYTQPAGIKREKFQSKNF